MKKNLLLAALLALSVCIPSACSDEEADPVRIKIISMGGSLSGYYILDGNETVGFSQTTLTNDIYLLELTFTELDNISIYTQTAATGTYLAVFVYKGDTQVKTSSQSGSAGTYSISMNYYYGETATQ